MVIYFQLLRRQWKAGGVEGIRLRGNRNNPCFDPWNLIRFILAKESPHPTRRLYASRTDIQF